MEGGEENIYLLCLAVVDVVLGLIGVAEHLEGEREELVSWQLGGVTRGAGVTWLAVVLTWDWRRDGMHVFVCGLGTRISGVVGVCVGGGCAVT